MMQWLGMYGHNKLQPIYSAKRAENRWKRRQNNIVLVGVTKWPLDLQLGVHSATVAWCESADVNSWWCNYSVIHYCIRFQDTATVYMHV
jgi:hypothetical protein